MGLKTSYKRLRKWHRSEGGIYYEAELAEIHRRSALRDKHVIQGFLTGYQYPPGHPEEAEILIPPGPNLVVDLGREALRELQATTAESNSSPGSKDLGYLAVGNGSSGGSTTPNPTDSALNSESTGATAGSAPSGVARPLLSVTTPPPGPPFTTNLWSGQFGSSELNSAPYNQIDEAGLYCLDNSTLYALRTFTTQTKASGFALELRWTIIL